jgi:translation initiation factor IF-2
VAKIRIYELARELGLESKDVVEMAIELGFEAKTASSSLEADDADRVRVAMAGSAEPAAEAEPEPEPTPEPEPEPLTASETPAEVEAVATPDDAEDIGIVSVPEGVSVADFAAALGQPTTAVVKELLTRGRPVGAAAVMPADLIDEVAETFGFIVETESPAEMASTTATPKAADERPGDEGSLAGRPPVVTVMGHVDHGKTTLLDSIRKTKVVAGEQGGITQHVGAYQVEVSGNKITFIDTPGHAAFSAMRARGANVTDIVVLVVAANDGVMPQTIEAISHAKAAGVQMVVAVNKIDLPGSDPFRVRTMLTEHDVITEDLGGDVPTVELSALTGAGVDNLLEVLDLIAQLQEYKANPGANPEGVVIESQLDPGMGPTATVIVQRGTLKLGDAFVAGSVSGRVRAMLDHEGTRLKEAGPSTPVLIMGWTDVPTAGDHFEVHPSDREARAVAAERAATLREEEQSMPSAKERLQSLLQQLRSEETELRIIIKADAHGSVEALRESVSKIARHEGRVDIVHSAVGGINENDVTLAEVTGSVIVGFNVRPDGKARKAAEAKGIEIRTYGIIYELLDELEKLLVGKLAPDIEEVVLGTAEVRAVFKVPRAGTIAGCYVTEGVMQRGAKARLLREGVVIHTGNIGSLRRFKDDVREVATGFECGIGLENYNDLKEGDVVEAFTLREVPRT